MTAAVPGTLVHASCVAIDGRGLLILGPSGSGKSALALQLLAFGARLVADDQTLLTVQDGVLTASCPANILGLIEARGVGLLRAQPQTSVQLCLAVDLAQPETDRLPPRRSLSLLGATLDLVLASQGNHFPAALLCYLKGGRQE